MKATIAERRARMALMPMTRRKLFTKELVTASFAVAASDEEKSVGISTPPSLLACDIICPCCALAKGVFCKEEFKFLVKIEIANAPKIATAKSAATRETALLTPEAEPE